jgi:hypothetical protein
MTTASRINIRSHTFSLSSRGISVCAQYRAHVSRRDRSETYTNNTRNVSCTIKCRSRVSSGSTVSDYGLDDRAIGVRSLAGAKDFPSNLCIQTGSEAHPASSPMGTGGKSRSGRDADHSPPSSAEVENE